MSLFMGSHLERLLQQRSASGQGFPAGGLPYWELYVSMKNYVHQNYYRSAGSGLATGGGRYTRHDISHVDDVIKMAGDLLALGDDRHGKQDALGSFEVFALLVAILLHDAGNAARREAHEQMALPVLREMGELSQLSALQARSIALIARVHGGQAPDGNKDTINAMILDPVSRLDGEPLHLRRLAAILRLADELSENPRRADPQALKKPYPSETSVIHNLYCKVINPHVDLPSGTITLEFDLDTSDLAEDFRVAGDEGRTVNLVEYIADRIDKCEAERIYCGRFLADFIRYDRIRVRLRVNQDYDELERIDFELSERGYPSHQKKVRDVESRFLGDQLRRDILSRYGNAASCG